MQIRKHLAKALAAILIAAALAVNAAPAQAANTPESVDVVFSVTDAESPEGFIFDNPNCPPDIDCKPQRVQAFITFVVSTNVSISGQTLTVKFATANNTAVAPGDYCATSGTVSFPPGIFSKAVKVCVNFNPAVEPAETFFLKLSNPSVPADTSDVGIATIVDGLELVN
jgi:Calx-beta domain-containing protein